MSWFSGASDALEEALVEQEKQRRQEMLDALNKRKAEAEMQDRAMARQLQAAQLQQYEALRKAQADAANEAMAQKVAETLGPNTQVDSDTSDLLRKGGLGALIQRQQVALPSTSITGVAQATDAAPDLTNVTRTANDGMGDVFRGTAKQLKDEQDRQAKLDYIKSLPADSKARKVLEAQVATGDNSISEKLFADENPQQPVYRINPRTGAVQKIGSAPKGAHFVNEPAPPPKVSVNVAGANGELTPEGVDYAATQYRVTGIMPPMGMGGTKNRTQIINKAAEQARILGQSPAASIQRQAAYKSDNAALNRMRTMASSAEAFEEKASAQADIVDGLSSRVPRTAFPLINSALLTGKLQTGDPNVAQFYNAITTFSTEYAKIMEGSTGSVSASSDSSRKAAERLIKASQSPKQLHAVLDLMRKEMQLTIDGYGATIDHITTRMGGTPPPTPADTPKTPRLYYDANGNPLKK